MSTHPQPTWAIPPFPHGDLPEADDRPELTVVPDAFLTRVRRGELRTVQPPYRWLRGAVHDADGRLVASSQKIGGLGGNQAAMSDPQQAAPPRQVRRLGGTWLYGGHWIQHFGHFAIETVTTLWPEEQGGGGRVGAPGEGPVEGIVFHSYLSRFRGVQPWQTELVGLAGFGHLPVEIIEDVPLRVDRLLVPGRSVVVNGWAHEAAAGVWTRMAHAAGGSTVLREDGDRVFLSRTEFNAGRRAAARTVRTDERRDQELDGVFAAAGFRVVAPERLSVAEQVRLAADASVLAGCAGSALHLSAFAPPGTRVLEVGDDRSPDWQVPMQQVVDRVREHPSAFVPHATSGAELARVLTDLGVAGA